MNDELITIFSNHRPKYEEKMKYFDECKIYTIQIESNMTCPQGCLYCYAASDDNNFTELSGKHIKEILNSSAKLDVKDIDWLGGDPLVRSDWYELMQLALELGLKNNIWTSGIPLKDPTISKKAVEVSEGGFISVHLDSLNEKYYNQLHVGTPEKKIKAILTGVENILSLGKTADDVINCITYSKLIPSNDVEHTINYFFETWGIKTCLTQLNPIGLAREHLGWVPTIQEIKEAVAIRDKINFPNSDVSFCTMDVNKYYCGGMACVTVDGDITPCSVIRKGFGNIKDATLESIIEENIDKLIFSEFHDTKNLPGHCGSCDNNSVCWGCRATAYNEYGDLLGGDPNCWIYKDHTIENK